MQRAKLLFVLTLVAASCAQASDEGLSGGTGSGGQGGDGGSGGSVSGSGGGGVGGAGGVGGTGGVQMGGSGGVSSGGTSGGSGGDAGASSGGAGGVSSGGASGSSATGGVSAGGAGGSVGGTGGSTGGAPATGFVVQYQVEISGASGSAIGSQLWVVNNGSNTVNLNDLKIRYYFTNEVTAALIQTINWANIGTTGGSTTGLGSGEITTNVATMSAPVAAADSYVEFGFNAGGKTLAPGYRVQFSWTVQNYASQSFVQSSDYSFNAALTSQADWQNVVLFQNQSVVWGIEP
jgi:hypothetical protein